MAALAADIMGEDSESTEFKAKTNAWVRDTNAEGHVRERMQALLNPGTPTPAGAAPATPTAAPAAPEASASGRPTPQTLPPQASAGAGRTELRTQQAAPAAEAAAAPYTPPATSGTQVTPTPSAVVPNITNDFNKPSSAYRDAATGEITVGNRPDDMMRVTSQAKSVALYYVLAQLGDKAPEFVRNNRGQIDTMLAANPHDLDGYKQAAHDVIAHAAHEMGTSLDIGTDSHGNPIPNPDFYNNMNAWLQNQEIAGRKIGGVAINDVTGGGKISASATSGVGWLSRRLDAKYNLNVFTHNTNLNEPDIYNTDTRARDGFTKAGVYSETRNVMVIAPDGGALAIASSSSHNADDIRNGIPALLDAGAGQHVAATAQTPAQTQGGTSAPTIVATTAAGSQSTSHPTSLTAGLQRANHNLPTFDGRIVGAHLPRTTQWKDPQNSNCAQKVREFLLATGIDLRTPEGQNPGPASSYAGTLLRNGFVSVGQGRGGDFTVAGARDMAARGFGNPDLPIVVVMTNGPVRAGHIFYIHSNDKTYSYFDQSQCASQTGVAQADAGKYRYEAFVYTGPVVNYGSRDFAAAGPQVVRPPQHAAPG